MCRFLVFAMILMTSTLRADIVTSNSEQLCNPISKGLHPYGMRDFHIILDNSTYYLLGTEIAKPGTEKRGIVLYKSDNLNVWKEVTRLVDRTKLKPDCWFYDEFKSPKISKIANKYYLTFSANNHKTNPYGSCGVAMAVADKIDGDYEILTPEKPIAFGNNFSLNVLNSNETIAYWDKDGKIYCSDINIKKANLVKPVVAIDQKQLRQDDHFLDAPSVFFQNGRYYLLYSVFKGGYRISCATAKSLKGPWEATASNDVFYRSENQAPTLLKMTYLTNKTYAPPCEIIGHAQLFVDLYGKLRIAYHSEDKYAEPFLCIDNVEIVDGRVICNPTLK